MTEILHRRTRLENTTLNREHGGRSHTLLSNMPAAGTQAHQEANSSGKHSTAQRLGAGGRSRPSACVLTVHAQCTHSARHSARSSARAGNGVNSTSSVEMA